MGPEHGRFWMLGRELLSHEVSPKPTSSPELGDLHVKVHAYAPEEREPGGELVDFEPRVETRPTVLDAVGDGESHLKGGGGPSLL